MRFILNKICLIFKNHSSKQYKYIDQKQTPFLPTGKKRKKMANVLGIYTIFLTITVGMALGYVYGPYEGCQDVYNNFNACQPYIEESGYDVPYECCNGLSILNRISKSEYGGSRRICQCIENMAASVSDHPPFSESRITNLYYKCNIHLNFPISEHMDCSR